MSSIGHDNLFLNTLRVSYSDFLYHLLSKMATKNKRDQICTHHLHLMEGNLPTSIRQPVYHTTVRNGQISWPPLRQTTHLERTCEKTRKHLDLKTRELNWLIGKRSPLSLTNKILIYEGWNFNSGNYLFTTDTK